MYFKVTKNDLDSLKNQIHGGDANPVLIVLVGPTAVGKTEMAVNLAEHFQTVVFNADSRQTYQELTIGTAKPSVDEMKDIKHYFVNDRSLSSPLNAGAFEKEVLQLLKAEFSSRSMAILSGGSGLYVKAVCEGFDDLPIVDPKHRRELNRAYEEQGLKELLLELEQTDPKYYKKVDRNNPQRVIRALELIRETGKPYSSFLSQSSVSRPFQTIKIGLDMPREELYNRIDQRVDEMIRRGLFEEAESLKGYAGHEALQTVGYQEVFGYLHEKYDYEEAVRLIKRNSRRYAKRQRTWFRKDPEITWFAPTQQREIIQLIQEKLDT